MNELGCTSVEALAVWLWVPKPQKHGQPIRDEIIPGLQRDRSQDWPSVILLAHVIFHIWKGATHARNLLPRMSFQCACSWYAACLSSPLSCYTERRDTTLVCKGSEGKCFIHQEVKQFIVVGCLLNVPATCKCILGMDLLRQLYVLPHWDRSCRPNFPSHPVTVYWHQANQSQHWPYNTRRLAG